ncbi:unnamed protein product [Prunus armeniaca]
MEERSLGEVLQYSGLPKRSRATEESEDVSELLIDLHVSPMIESELNQVSFLSDGPVSFRDKLMKKVDLVKNVGINIDCLDDAYDDLNDEEDVIISRGDRGPCIQFSDRAMSRLGKP